LIFNQHALDFTVGRSDYLKMTELKYMGNVGCAQEDREQMHRVIVSRAQSLQNFMTGCIWDLWLCFLLFLHLFLIEWYSGKKSSSVLFQHTTPLFECRMLASDPLGVLYIPSCQVLMLSDWYPMLYNPSPDGITTVHCPCELSTIMLIFHTSAWPLPASPGKEDCSQIGEVWLV
jgi:hypothetical protein